MLRKGHAAIRTVRRSPVRHHPGRSVDGRRPPLRRDRTRGAGPAGRPGTAPTPSGSNCPSPTIGRAWTATTARPISCCAGRTRASWSRTRSPPSTPTGWSRTDGHATIGVLGGTGHRRRERGDDPPPRADPPQGQDRPARPPDRHPGQPLPHLGALADPGPHRDLRTLRSAPGRRRSTTTASATSCGSSRTTRPSVPCGRPSAPRRWCWPTATTASRRPAPTGRGGPATPGADLVMALIVELTADQLEVGPDPPGPLRPARRTRPGRRVLLVVRPDPGGRLRRAHHQRPRAVRGPGPADALGDLAALPQGRHGRGGRVRPGLVDGGAGHRRAPRPRARVPQLVAGGRPGRRRRQGPGRAAAAARSPSSRSPSGPGPGGACPRRPPTSARSRPPGWCSAPSTLPG